MAGRVLGIEFSSNRTTIVEASYGRQLKIFNYAVIESASVEPERRAEQLQHTLKLRGFEARDAVVAVSGAGMEHRLLTLPQMSERQLTFVMQREARKIAASPEFVSSYEMIRTEEQLGIKKEQLLLVTAEASSIRQTQGWFAQTSLRVQRMTSVSESIANLSHCTGIDRRDTPQAIAHISGGRLHLVFVEGGVMLLCRDVQFEFGGASSEELVARLITEIKRSTLLFRQNFPNSQIGQIHFSGAGDFLGTLANQSKEELGIETTVIRYEDLLDQTSFRGEWDEFRFHLPALSAAIGAAWRKVPGSGINLLPGSPSGARKTKVNGASIAKIAAAAALALTVATAGYYYAATSTLEDERTALEVRNSAIQPRVDQAAAADQQRLLASKIGALLRQMRVGGQWTEVFRALTFIVPSSALFESVRMEGTPPKMIVTGSLSAPTVQQANADFSKFFNGLRGLEYFSAVTLSKPLTVVNENVAGATPSAPEFQSRVSFEVQCEWISEN